MELLVQAGFSTGEVFEAVGDTLNLAAAGSLDLADAANITAGTLRAFNLAAKESGRVADVLAETAASSNTTVYQLGDAMTYIAPIAANAGWSIEETAAAIGMLGNVNIKASMAGTTLRGAITQLLHPTSDAMKAMEALGITMGDPNEKMLSLREILEQVDPAIVKTAGGLEALTVIFGRRATAGIAAVIQQGTDKLGAFTEQLENCSGASEEMAKTKLDNLKGAFTLLKSSLEAVGIALVTGGEESLAGGIKSFISGSLIPMVNKTAEWIDQVGGLPGMLKMAWEILVAFGNRIKDAFVMLGDWETFSDFVWAWGIMCAGATLTFSQFLGNLILAVGDVASVIWLPFIAPFSVVLNKINGLLFKFLNWFNKKFTDFLNNLIKPFKWVFDKIGIELKEFKYTEYVVEPFTVEEAWEAGRMATYEKGLDAAERIKKSALDTINELKAVGGAEKGALGILGLDPESFINDVDKIVEKY